MQRPSCGCGPVPWQHINSGLGAQASFNKGSDGHFASTYIFQFGLGSALPRTTILHLNVRPIEGVKWSTIQVQKSTIYLQFALQLNRRLRGRGAHFWSTIYLQSTPLGWEHVGLTGEERRTAAAQWFPSAAQAARINARCLDVPFILI